MITNGKYILFVWPFCNSHVYAHKHCNALHTANAAASVQRTKRTMNTNIRKNNNKYDGSVFFLSNNSTNEINTQLGICKCKKDDKYKMQAKCFV